MASPKPCQKLPGPDISVFEVYRYSVARVHEATLWTQDADLRSLDGVKYVDAHGSR